MPPKNKGKKSKKQDDDDYWEQAGTSVLDNNVQSGSATPLDGDGPPTVDAEDEDFGGLMSAIKASKSKNKKKGNGHANGGDQVPAEKKDTEDAVVAQDAQGAEGDAGNNTSPIAQHITQFDTLITDDASNKNDDDDDGPKVLSKKEKERLKKEREKARKKAQATAKKLQGGGDVEQEPAGTSAPAKTAAPVDEEQGEGDEEGGAKTDKKKKKKKGKTADDATPAPAAAPSGGKKKAAAGISALKAMMEEKRRLEEEAKRLEEEEQRRIQEEEARAEEEARKKEEEKQRRKEKEKAKRELAKKEGRLLTKKQKEELRAAELRKQALLASGVQIEGLQQPSGDQPARKVVYGGRKKKPAVGRPDSKPPTREQSPIPLEPQPSATAQNDIQASAEEPADVKDEWDVSSGDEAPATPTVKVKDSWDEESADESELSPPHQPASSDKKQKQVDAKTSQASVPATKPSKKEDDESDESESEDEDSDSDSNSDSDSEAEAMSSAQRALAKKKAEAAERRAQAHEAALAARNKDDLRSPICCILGHVDTGKTKLLDKIRQTNVQEGEAGGITQQIGATYFPVDAIKTKTAVLNKDGSQEYKIPGLLVIDTPGHESFTNLRTRGSSLCNIAVLVVDIMHGLEPQTLESLRLLRDRKTPFIVALNKIDRMYGWQAFPDNDFRDSLAKQSRAVQREFEDRTQKTILAFAEQGLNAVLYYDNKSFARNVSLVPTSAITGEGIPDMIMLLVNLTQQRMSDRLMYLSELECTVLEVKVIEGLGTTIDVVLSNGILHEGDRIVPLRELRIKSAYVHHSEVKAALGVKILAPDLEKAIAGSRLMVVGPDDDEDELMDEIMSDLTTLMNAIDKSGRGVCVQASTLGSLEALLEFLKVSKIPVSGINIGPVHQKDIKRAATMLEKAKELACILCFDVPVDKEAERLAEEMGIRLFKADIIYHLFDAFTAYNAEITEAKRRDAAPQAVWPCRLKIIAAFAKRDPIILGVDILDGTLRVGTPLCVIKVDPETQKKEIIELGKITSLEINHKTQEIVKKSQGGGGVAVKIEHAVYQSAKMFGRHFDDKDEIYSRITRQSIDVLKTSFKEDVSTEEWLLIKALKPRLNIQ
ncbi:hypothetical protein EUX98_g2032 [Antrodiella citrinella]|uniref:Eukaryotic translation initiation factor 5B n=1 Tax=Antrodiella citrinella TaxID=2447956 RepID=A0A4S4N2B9_9APHY|nr:hypothetical protein EUX98_g2032 [Antrodiella citrinella]